MTNLDRFFLTAAGKLQVLALVLDVQENQCLLERNQSQLKGKVTRPGLNNKIILLVPLSAKVQNHISLRSGII